MSTSMLMDEVAYGGGSSLTVKLVRAISDKLGPAKAQEFVDRNLPEKIAHRLEADELPLEFTQDELPILNAVIGQLTRRDFFRNVGKYGAFMGATAAGTTAAACGNVNPQKKRILDIYHQILYGSSAVTLACLVTYEVAKVHELNEKGKTSEMENPDEQAKAFLQAMEPQLRGMKYGRMITR